MLGILYVVFGAVCIIGNVAATFATILVCGWLLLFSSGFALVQAFMVGTWGGFFLCLLSALLRGVTGYVLIRHPLEGAIGATLILAAVFVASGMFRTIAAAVLRFPAWGWTVVSGVITLILGVTLFADLPVSALWFIGFAIGLDMFLDGFSLIGFSRALAKQPA
ncbi:MAG: DUF308 domain-containing protein [Acidobacteria bacterium]|nr:DUF308 domain-containing protein [Acidobacteriota bacterium]